MSSVTLYRKYRPQTFAEIVNQDHVKTTIQQELISDSLPHAFLFHGPRGIGKTTTARILAKVLNCTNRKKEQSEPCNSCDSCMSMTEGKSLSLVEVDAASQTGVDNVRDNIIANARVAVKGDEFKVFIIDEVHMLSTSSFNALLKTLEEPPNRVLFILATTEIHKIPDTIISRCQRFDFHPIHSAELKAHLADLVKKEKRKVDDEVLSVIVRKSGGHARDAISLLSQVLSVQGEITLEKAALVMPVVNLENVLRFFEIIQSGDPAAGMVFLDELEQSGFKPKHYCDNVIEFAHDLMLYTLQSHPDIFSGILNQDQTKQLEKLASHFTPQDLLELIDVLMKRRLQLRDFNQGKLPLELAILELTGTQKTAVNETVKSAEKKTSETPPVKPKVVPESPKKRVQPEVTPIRKKKDLPTTDPVVLESVDTQGGDPATFSEIKNIWKSLMAAVSEQSHSLFIILRTAELREQEGKPALAFRFRMHHDHVKRSLHTLIEQGKTLLPDKTIQFILVVDENMDYASGSDVEEPKQEEKEELAQELNELAQAFGGSVME